MLYVSRGMEVRIPCASNSKGVGRCSGNAGMREASPARPTWHSQGRANMVCTAKYVDESVADEDLLQPGGYPLGIME